MASTTPRLARADQNVYDGWRETAEAIIDDAERRAVAQGVSFRGADALSPRESIVDRRPDPKPGARAAGRCGWRT